MVRKHVFSAAMSMLLTVCGCAGGGNALTSCSAFPLDGLVGLEGGMRFTCTGFCYNPQDSFFYMGNIGADLPQNFDKCRSSIVVLSSGLDSCLYEIAIADIFPTMKDVQGIAVIPTDNTLWFCSFSENKVRHITPDGCSLGYMEINRPTGIAYDSRRKSLWILTYTELMLVSLQGEIIVSYPMKEKGQDQLYYDDEKDRILMTAGWDYQGSGLVFEIQPQDGKCKLLYRLLDAHAIEGITIKDGLLFIANDGFYHSAKIPVNQVNAYQLPEKTDDD